MAQDKVSRRGVTNVVSCAVLLLFGLLGLAAGCSSEAGSGQEDLASESQAQVLCTCPADNPCATFSCSLTVCKATVLIKEGEVCTNKLDGYHGVCHLNLCCPGCVVPGGKGGTPPTCAARGGVEDTICGDSGTTCKNCTSDSCQYGTCEAKACAYKPVPEGEACTNTTGGCHNGVCCQGCVDGNDVCQPGGAIDNCGASTSKLAKCQDCLDKNDCTAEACINGVCDYPATPPPAACGDANKCNGDEACSGTTCQAGKMLNCDDGQECTTDTCDATDGCLHKARTGAPCNFGDPCTTGDTCGADGLCKKGSQINCDDGEICTADSCAAGKCLNKAVAENTICNDGDMCTTGDKCVAGKCKGTSANGVDCNDGKACTVDAQVACNSTMCNHTPAPVDAACIADKCHEAGHCSGTDDTCVAGPAIDCDDSNPCTKDTCNTLTGCAHANDPAANCSDGDACTENDVCVGGLCGGKPKTCLALDSCHEPGTCDPKSGTCDDPRAADNKECPGGACQSGKCILDPNAGLGGEGGGASGGAGGEGGGANVVSGGAGPTTPVGEAGTPEQPGDGGTAPVSEPDRPFIRTPGGCACEVPSSGSRDHAIWLIGLAFLAGSARRRSRRGRLAA